MRVLVLTYPLMVPKSGIFSPMMPSLTPPTKAWAKFESWLAGNPSHLPRVGARSPRLEKTLSESIIGFCAGKVPRRLPSMRSSEAGVPAKACVSGE